MIVSADNCSFFIYHISLSTFVISKKNILEKKTAVFCYILIDEGGFSDIYIYMYIYNVYVKNYIILLNRNNHLHNNLDDNSSFSYPHLFFCFYFSAGVSDKQQGLQSQCSRRRRWRAPQTFLWWDLKSESVNTDRHCSGIPIRVT